jgi:hypothetical protein
MYLDDAVEGAALEVEGLARATDALLTSAESPEVLSSCNEKKGEGQSQLKDDRRRRRGDARIALLGTTSAKSSMVTRPAAWPPMVISKKTRGLAI